LPSALTSRQGPLSAAPARKAQAGSPGSSEARPVANGEGWRVLDIVCTYGPRDRPFEEHFRATSISFVVAGSFVYRSERSSSLMSSGALLLGNAGHTYECSHQDDDGDRCLSFQFDEDLFERVAHDLGAPPRLNIDRLPPLRVLAPLNARALRVCTTASATEGTGLGQDSVEEIALELAGAVIRIASAAASHCGSDRICYSGCITWNVTLTHLYFVASPPSRMTHHMVLSVGGDAQIPGRHCREEHNDYSEPIRFWINVSSTAE
jgi:hypothetical protein